MNNEVLAFLLASGLALLAAGLGLLLYRFGMARIEYRSARVGGAVAVAGLAFYLMSWFYFEQLDRAKASDAQREARLTAAVADYDVCAAHEKVFACREPATKVRELCQALVAR